ncbi:MAG: hypothetical protein ACRD3T_12745, partial [Terriglobia bacterium]
MTSRLAPKREVLIVSAAILAYTLLAVELARVRPPDHDEGDFGNAAVLFENQHILGMPMYGHSWLPEIGNHLYITPPLYFVGLSVWFRIWGVGLITMRLFSVFWGAIALLAWYLAVRAMTKDPVMALLSLILIGLNYDYLNLTSARYDVMCASLSAAGLAAYGLLRERHFDLALLLLS